MKTNPTSEAHEDEACHVDPLTGEPGAHPIGAGVGAATGGAAMAVVGAIAGPVGSVVGLAVGAVVGGLTGKGFAEGLDPTSEEAKLTHDHAAASAEPMPAEPLPGSMEYHLSTRPLHEGHPANTDEAASRIPGSMEDHLTTKPLAWAADERAEAEKKDAAPPA
jgi:hypothetical protein